MQQKQSLLLQASHLQVQAANLQTQAADLQTQAAQLQTQQVKLQNQQQSAQSQQKQAKQLQSELTDEVTQAGGDPRGTDTRLVNLQNALGATQGVKVVSPPQINKPGNAATFNVDRHDRTCGAGHRRPGEDAPRRTRSRSRPRART